MKSQKPSATSRGVYRCPKHSRQGECPAPSTVTKNKLEQYVIDQFVRRYSALSSSALDVREDEDVVEAAIQAERAYRDQLENIELRNTIGAPDHDRLLAALYREWKTRLAKTQTKTKRATIVPEGVNLADLVHDLADDADELRELLSSGIQAVFVRPAASRSHNLPIEDRVHIVWVDDDPVDIPRRGLAFEPRSFDW